MFAIEVVKTYMCIKNSFSIRRCRGTFSQVLANQVDHILYHLTSLTFCVRMFIGTTVIRLCLPLAAVNLPPDHCEMYSMRGSTYPSDIVPWRLVYPG